METSSLLLSVAVVVALVNLLKRLGVTGTPKLAAAAVLFGVALGLSDYGFLVELHSAAGWYRAIAGGLLIGLSAAGVYDLAVASRKQD